MSAGASGEAQAVANAIIEDVIESSIIVEIKVPGYGYVKDSVDRRVTLDATLPVPYRAALAIDALVQRKVEEERLRTAKNLALVEMALASDEEADAVRKITGGNAPEQVQGILDAITVLRDSLRTPPPATRG